MTGSNERAGMPEALTMKIERDPDPLNPREEWDHLGVMVCFHRRHNLGDASELRAGNFSGWEEMEDRLRKHGAVIVLPLYLYDHSGLTMRTWPFSCPWDSGQVGFVYATREAILGAYNRQRLSQKLRDKVERCLRAEVEAYDQYLRGDVWGYTVETATGEHLDSCWGFFGESYCREEAEQSLRWHRDRATAKGEAARGSEA